MANEAPLPASETNNTNILKIKYNQKKPLTNPTRIKNKRPPRHITRQDKHNNHKTD